jgi:hypothetical protein
MEYNRIPNGLSYSAISQALPRIGAKHVIIHNRIVVLYVSQIVITPLSKTSFTSLQYSSRSWTKPLLVLRSFSIFYQTPLASFSRCLHFHPCRPTRPGVCKSSCSGLASVDLIQILGVLVPAPVTDFESTPFVGFDLV